MNNHRFYSKDQLEAMDDGKLLKHAKILSIPADENWSKKQMVSVIDYYQTHTSSTNNIAINAMNFFKGSGLKIIFICISLIWMYHSNANKSCATGLCYVEDNNSEFTFDKMNEKSDKIEKTINPGIADAVTSVTNEFAEAALKSSEQIRQRYSELMKSVKDLQHLYQTCQQNIGKIKYVLNSLSLFILFRIITNLT